MATPTSVTIPNYGELHDPLGRSWPNKAIHECIVGRLFADLTYDQIVTYLQWVHKPFLDVTSQEVQTFWDGVLPRSRHFRFWEPKSINSAEVKQTLEAMKVEWNMWRDLGDENVQKELGEE